MTEKTPKEQALETRDLVQQISPLLAGRDPGVQSAALADLTAMWLAGHVARDARKTDAVREHVLRDYVALIRRLIPINAKLIDAELERRARPN